MTERTFTGHNDRGQRYAILYTANGVRWVWGEKADQIHERVAPRGPGGGGSSSASAASAVAGAADILQAFTGPIGAVSGLIDSITGVLNWWEARQYRQMEQARFEEERRIPWLFEMMRRWVLAHEGRDHLDLHISHFLAREASATLAALGDNAKMSVPQVLLYDLDRVRSTVGALRGLMLEQFETVSRSLDLSQQPTAFVMGGVQGPHESLSFNMDWVRRWADDPARLWDRCAAKGDLSEFDEELGLLTRAPETLVAQGFAHTASVADSSSTYLSGALKTILAVSAGGLFVPALTLAGVGTGAFVAAEALGRLMKAKNAARRDDFRELALLASEIGRVRLLHLMWLALEETRLAADGTRPLVLEDWGMLVVAAPQDGGYRLLDGARTTAPALPERVAG